LPCAANSLAKDQRIPIEVLKDSKNVAGLARRHYYHCAGKARRPIWIPPRYHEHPVGVDDRVSEVVSGQLVLTRWHGEARAKQLTALANLMASQR
jgi:hypothetical protein